MAYYDDGYTWPQEHTGYDLDNSVSFSDYESYDLNTYDEPKFIDYYNHNDDYNNSYSSSHPETNYFAYNFVEPKLIMYEPVACNTAYVSYHVQHSVSYSTVNDTGFNEREFEEYDPTPYGGGYDIVSHYGKPLPPSDKTCYPHSNPKPIQPKPKPEPEPHKPMHEPELEPMHKPMSEPKHGRKPLSVSFRVPLVEPESELEPMHVLDPEPDPEPREEYGYSGYGYDYPWPEYDKGNEIGVGYDYGYGYGKQVVQVRPCEYDREVVDLCENIFGSWPCLDRIRKQQMGMDNNPGIASNPGNRYNNPWEGCASYLFGCPNVSYN